MDAWASFARRVRLWIAGLLVAAGLTIVSSVFASELPRDVGGETAAGARLGSLPPDFHRMDPGWIAFEFPSSVLDRVQALLPEADSFKAKLSADLGQEVLEQVLVRIARGPSQMADLAPAGEPPPDYASGVAYPDRH